MLFNSGNSSRHGMHQEAQKFKRVGAALEIPTPTRSPDLRLGTKKGGAVEPTTATPGTLGRRSTEVLDGGSLEAVVGVAIKPFESGDPAVTAEVTPHRTKAPRVANRSTLGEMRPALDPKDRSLAQRIADENINRDHREENR